MIFIIIFLLITNVVAIIAATRLYRKNEIYEELIVDVYDSVKETYEYMQYIDELGSFEADDEVGYAFKELHRAVGELHKYIETERNEQYIDEEEETQEK